jgi:hypothetical protein
MSKHKDSIDAQIMRCIIEHGEGWVFTPSHFLDLGSRDAVDTALKRYTRAGSIRKIARGLYELPRQHALIGYVAPSAEAIAQAVQGRDAIRLQPSGAYAANQLGLSEQMPLKIVFYTDGPTRRLTVGKQQIQLKHTTPRTMATAGRISGVVIQALRYLGRPHVDDELIARMRHRLSPDEKRQLLQDLRYVSAWVAAMLRRIAEEKE